MALIDKFKILDDEIKTNQAQYDLDREKVKISQLSFGELEKCKYLTGKDLEYKPGVGENLSLNILNCVKCSIKDWMKKTEKNDF